MDFEYILLSVLGIIISPFVVYLLFKIATFAILKAKADFKRRNNNGQEEGISTGERKA